MRWSQRLKLTWQTFIREATALYGWYLIFGLVIGVLTVIVMVGAFLPMIVNGFAANHSTPHPAPLFPGGQFFGYASPFSPFFNGTPPDFYDGVPFERNGQPYWPLIGGIAGAFGLAMIVSLIAGAVVTAGIFNLTRKALHEKPAFRDFKLEGTGRVLGWAGITLLVALGVLAAGALGYLAFRHVKILLVLYLIVYCVALLGIGIFLLPWAATAQFYLLARRDLRFWSALGSSFTFFRRHMGTLWAYVGTALLIVLLTLLLGQISEGVYFLVSLITTPFNLILPMVWVLSLLEEERGVHRPQPVPEGALTTPAGVPTPNTQADRLNTSPGVENSAASAIVPPGQSGTESPGEGGSASSFVLPEIDTFSTEEKTPPVDKTPSAANDITANDPQTAIASESIRNTRVAGTQALENPSQKSGPEPSELSPSPNQKDRDSLRGDHVYQVPPDTPGYPEQPPAIQTQGTGGANFCSFCGSKTRPGANYCSQCGAKL